MKPSEIIRDGWCQGAFARDSQGNKCAVMDAKAELFCLFGAIVKAYYETPELIDKASIKITEALNNRSLTEWNDSCGRTHEEVINLLEYVGE